MYNWGREWPYKDIKKRIIAEPLLEDPSGLTDYKFFCFNGKMKCFKIFGIVVHATNHPASRYYFMTRNMLIVKEKDKKGKPNTEITKLVLKIIFFEHGKAAKLHAVWKGLIHFRKWHKSKKRRETSN